MTAIVTRTWTVRVCQFRHSCISNYFAAPQLTKHIIQQRHLNVNTFFLFFQMHIFYIFSKNCWHYALLLVSSLLVGNNNNDTCGSVGTGRRARLRILWLLQSCGFKSHLPHYLIWCGSLIIKASALFLFLNCLSALEHVHIRHFATDCRFVGRYSIFQRFRCKNVTLLCRHKIIIHLTIFYR